MKPLRIVYLTVLAASLILAFVSRYKYHFQGKELSSYQMLSYSSNEALNQISAKLTQSKEELDKSLKNAEGLNLTIAALEKENSSFKSELLALKEDREKLQTKIARLVEDNAILERRFRSLEELKKAIRVVNQEQKTQNHLVKIAMLRKMDELALQYGNHGFMVKNGISTFTPKPKVKVELEPITHQQN